MSLIILPSFYKGRSRRSDGKYASRREKNFSLILLFTSVFVSALVMQSGEKLRLNETLYPTPMFSQPDAPDFFVGQAKAWEIEPPKATAPQTIEDRIRERFQENGEKMIKIAKCESGIRPEAVGDKNLTFVLDGVTYGTSHGVFQIRHLKGRPSPEKLHDVTTNIEIAYKLSNGGKDTGAWRNCTRKLGL